MMLPKVEIKPETIVLRRIGKLKYNIQNYIQTVRLFRICPGFNPIGVRVAIGYE